jgi:hypothetical protein
MEETGADFTNSFRVLSRIPLPSSHDFESELEAVKIYLVSQCCTAEELKRAHRPQMDPRFGFDYLKICKEYFILLSVLTFSQISSFYKLERNAEHSAR